MLRSERLPRAPVLWWTTEVLQRRQVGLLVRRQSSEVDFAIRYWPRLDKKPHKNQIFHHIEILNVANDSCMEY